MPSSIGPLRSCNLAKTADIYKYQQRVAISNPVTCQKHTKCHGPMSTTTNCHQYLPGMTMTKKKEKKRKNLLGTLTKPGKSAMIKKTYQSGSGKKAIKKKGKKMKKTNLKPTKPPKPAPVTGEKPTQPTPDQSHHMKTIGHAPITIANHATVNAMGISRDKTSGTINHVSLVENNCLTKGCEMTFLVEEESNAKVEGASPNEILEIKNNPPKPTDIVLVLNLDAFLDLENSPEEFYEHYQNLASTKEEQEQYLEEINT
ncbi:hypothetical protein G9A89_011280 [Geosiphon pyriformis]|nr:hypothetical protein G9A89_011280 [Geosiphon pyriformis]